ncbi:CidA/LrgA family holin-like protein [Peribacillus sp. JNUCC 23]|uniref:CidA/LrgA family holin-like protein n=1 Tax=Peribacillus sp. NPDC096379 TaxID=3364393 RepID=UPI000784114A
MKIIKIIIQIAILYAFSFIGNILHDFFNLPIPGSIIGMLLLLIGLSLKIIPLQFIEAGVGFLLKFLSLLFIPAMLGIMNYPSLVSFKGVLLIVITVISTLITMGAAGMMSQYLEKRAQIRKEKEKCSKHYSQSL